MKKLLSALLGIFGLLSAFATPSWGACNMFHIEPQTYNGVTLTIRDDGAYVLNGTCENSGNFLIGLQSLGAGTYTLALIDRELDPDMAGTQVQAYSPSDIGTNMVVKMDSGENYVTRTFDTDYNDVQYRIRIQAGIVYNNYVIKPMFVKGATVPTEYTPYNPLCATCDGTVVNYTSATGTGVQNGTPTPTNPIEPTFYTQGDMILRKVGNIADSYDATTGKITRRVGVKVLNGTESNWASDNVNSAGYIRFLVGISGKAKSMALLSSAFSVKPNGVVQASETSALISGYNDNSNIYLTIPASLLTGDFSTSQGRVAAFRQWLADQYNAGTPVTIYYPLETETTEDWPASYCETPIKIATTKYNETKFSPLNTALANAISVVDSVVSNTITQAGRIATLQTQKQTRPNDIADDNEKCPAGKKCLLVEDASGVPHWYEIVERYSLLPDGYTELEYIESTGEQYIDTGLKLNQNSRVEIGWNYYTSSDISTSGRIFGSRYTSVSDKKAFVIGTNTGKADPNTTMFFQYGNTSKAGPNVSIGTWLDIVFDKNVHTINGTQYGESFTDITFETPYTIKIFAFGQSAGSDETETVGAGVGRCSYFKIYNNGTLVRDFVPAKNASGVVGMYDTVNGVFYENKGTGEFIAGDPVVE